MKKSELRQLIKEELKKSLLKENTGLITFEQLKQAVFTSYKEYVEEGYDTEDSFFEDIENIGNEILSADNVDELVNILDGMGFNGNEAYDFIFDSILK